MEKQLFETRGIRFNNLSPKILVGMLLILVLSVLAPFHFSWIGLGLFFFMTWLTACPGITLCYHRLLTHGAFKTPRWFMAVLIIIAYMAWQGNVRKWCGVHRQHHKDADGEADPHTPNHGLPHSHVTWTMHQHSDEEKARFDALIEKLIDDPLITKLDRFFIWPNLLLIPLFYFVGEWLKTQGFATTGLSLVTWGVGLRTFVVWNGTWFVNSAAHTWGYQNFETGDRSKNLWWVALLSFGEGWHNNHHAFQKYAKHGLLPHEIDMTWWLICFLEKIGLAWDIFIDDRWKTSSKFKGNNEVSDKDKAEDKDLSQPVRPLKRNILDSI